MTKRIGDLLLVILGSMITGLGIAFMVKGNLGLDALTLFNGQLGKLLGISLGSASQLFMITILSILFFVDRKRVGLGSVMNGILVGAFADFFIPFVNRLGGNNFLGFFILIIGLTLMSIGVGTYVSARLGEGGIDALMIFFAEKLHKDVKVTRIAMDISLAGAGFLLGGQVGMGTLIAMFMNGPVIQATIGIIDKIRAKEPTLN